MEPSYTGCFRRRRHCTKSVFYAQFNRS